MNSRLYYRLRNALKRNPFFHVVLKLLRDSVIWSYQALFTYKGYIRNYLIFPIAGKVRTLRKGHFYKKYAEIENYKDIHKGERCFIIATGSSLTSDDVLRLQNETTFGVNGVSSLYDSIGWKPDYYVRIDLDGLLKMRERGENTNLDEMSKIKSFTTELSRKKGFNFKNTIYVPYCWLDHYMNYRKVKKLKYSEDLLYGAYDLYSVGHFTICLAAYMGFGEINLLGFDCNYSKSDRAHFYDNDSCEQDKLNLIRDQRMKFAHQFLYEKMLLKGVCVNNVTRGGNLNVYPRKNLEDVLDSVYNQIEG